MGENREIPKGWATTSIQDIAEVIMGQSPSSATYNNNGIGLPFFQGKAEFTDLHPVAEKWCTEPKKIAVNDDILLSVRAPVGATNIADRKCCIGRGLAAIRYHYNHKLIYYYLRLIERELDEQGTGTTFKAISGEVIRNTRIPLPPIPEQHRIVAKIEELFSRLDKGIESLKTAQQQLKVYRQAVLKWAFEGNWDVSRFGNVAEIKRGKSKHRPRDAKELFGGPYPFIQTGEVRAANGGTVNTYSQTYSEIGLAQSKLWPKGTLCLTIAANIAETAFLGFDACFPDSVVGIKTDENILSIKFVNFYIQKLKQEIDSKASATAQKNINVEFLENIPIPIPKIEDQHAIVAEIESRLFVCDKIEESIEQSLKQAESLRQSILKKAFEGKLVPQDSNDEPASVLLARIKAERESNKAEVVRHRQPRKKKARS
ncbi:conserved hypothetical protein [uncultured Desulfobacterium sp.]|uniref:Type I restriction modification DNA specificity domain-containing protein n=1 Tax=uncultured Desulfobacterium sp. TaxID=201089 RepID=A0A445MTV8_9BACT|nr:conserved hypothetical protein [uncultured Desulfobacterium sp.]